MAPWRLLLTGPVRGLERWRAALAAVPAFVTESLEVLERPLIELVPRALPPVAHRPDWLCVTSASALPALEPALARLAGTPTAVVGERSAEALAAAGLRVEVGPCASAEALLEAWLPRLRAGQRVLWPRGSESDALARPLAAAGAVVEAPIVYETHPSADRRALPAAELVFFASPSAVRAFTELERVDPPGPATAIAIGPTTTEALRALEGSPFARLEELDAPRPEALVRALERLRRTQP